jgi:hypothetical protein
MRYGTCYGSTYGDPAAALEFVRLWPRQDGDTPTSRLVSFKPRTGCGDAWFAICVCGQPATEVFAAEGFETDPVRLTVPVGATSISVEVLRLGYAQIPLDNLTGPAQEGETDARRVSARWSWSPRVEAPANDGGKTSAWNLSGLFRANTGRIAARTRGLLTFDVDVTDGVATVAVYAGDNLVASGAATLSGATVVTLAAEGSSGLSGAVTLAADTTSFSDGELLIRWPSAMQVLRGTANPPTVVVATGIYNERDAANWIEPADLSGGTYYYRLRSISDTGDVGDVSAISEFVVSTIPQPVSGLAYARGNAAATVLAFVGSLTAGVTFEAFVQAMGALAFDLETAAATAAPAASRISLHAYAQGAFVAPATPNGYRYECTTAGTSGVSAPGWTPTPGATITDGTCVWTCRKYEITLPFLSGSPGTARVLVRAVLGELDDDGNANFVELPYDASGVYVAPAPNAPELREGTLAITGGRTLALQALYSSLGEAGAATKVHLFVAATADGFDWDSPADEELLANLGAKQFAATLSTTPATNGTWYLAAKAVTAGGTQGTSSNVVAVFVSDENQPAPGGVLFARSRG